MRDFLKNDNPRHRKQARHLRANQTSAENALWQQLRNRQVNNLKFRRQHLIGNYIVDFYCVEKKLVIEIDGDAHQDRGKLDLIRTQWLESLGLRVLRFPNDEVLESPMGVVDGIIEFLESNLSPLT